MDIFVKLSLFALFVLCCTLTIGFIYIGTDSNEGPSSYNRSFLCSIIFLAFAIIFGALLTR